MPVYSSDMHRSRSLHVRIIGRGMVGLRIGSSIGGGGDGGHAAGGGGRMRFMLEKEKNRYLYGGITTDISNSTVVVGKPGLPQQTGNFNANVNKGVSAGNYSGITGSITVRGNVVTTTGSLSSTEESY